MMDCDTTGVEPDIALVKYKKLVGGGMIKIVNNTVPDRPQAARLRQGARSAPSSSTSTRTTPSRAPRTSRKSTCRSSTAPSSRRKGSRSIHYMGHLKMLAAVQPFISGAISKTINMPEDSTPEDILQAYVEGWQMGLKAVAIYRDNCKRSQPLSTKKGREGAAAGRRSPLQPSAGPCAASCRTSARRSPTSSRSTGTRATSPSASTRTASRARSSWSWRRRARPSRA